MPMTLPASSSISHSSPGQARIAVLGCESGYPSGILLAPRCDVTTPRTEQPFRDRREAGEMLARDLARYRAGPDTRGDTVVLGLARGGVPVGREVANHLRVPLEVCLVRKLGAPKWPELAMGAVASGGAVVLNDDVLAGLGLSDDEVSDVVQRET